jgi:hypothetical protein
LHRAQACSSWPNSRCESHKRRINDVSDDGSFLWKQPWRPNSPNFIDRTAEKIGTVIGIVGATKPG